MGATITKIYGSPFDLPGLTQKEVALSERAIKWIADSCRRHTVEVVVIPKREMKTWIWRVFDARQAIRSKDVEVRFTREEWGSADEVRLIRGNSILLFTTKIN